MVGFDKRIIELLKTRTSPNCAKTCSVKKIELYCALWWEEHDLFHEKRSAKTILDFKNYFSVGLHIVVYHLFVLTSYYL